MMRKLIGCAEVALACLFIWAMLFLLWSDECAENPQACAEYMEVRR